MGEPANEAIFAAECVLSVVASSRDGRLHFLLTGETEAHCLNYLKWKQ